jgi:threonine/homoserine/homoserine lactone efflux protein
MSLSHSANLALYFLMVFGIIALPGMDMAFVLASTIRGGRRSGFAALGGIVTGGFVHVAMGALGLAVLLKTVPAAFNLVLVAGALYVAWIGWSLLRAADGFGGTRVDTAAPTRAAYRQGIVTCLLNPKAYLFMLAVFPQFILPDDGPVWLQAVELGIIGAFSQVAVYGGVALIADRARSWLEGDSRSQVMMARTVGLILITAAIFTGLQGWRNF